MTTILDIEKHYVGTCQCCFHRQVIKITGIPGSWLMYLHGYQRPGDGETVGRCPGTDQQPYELDHNLVDEFVTAWGNDAVMIAKTLKSYTDDKVDSLYVKFDTGKRDFEHRTIYERVVVGRDYKGDPKDSCGPGRNFEWHRQDRIREIEGDLRHANRMLEFYTQKRVEWVYNPTPAATVVEILSNKFLVEHDIWKAEEERKTKEERAVIKNEKGWVKAFKNLSTAFRYLGTAINRHKKGCRNGNSLGDTFDEQAKQLEELKRNTINGEVRKDFYGRRFVFVLDTYAFGYKNRPTNDTVSTVEELTARSLPPFEAMYPGFAKPAKTKKMKA